MANTSTAIKYGYNISDLIFDLSSIPTKIELRRMASHAKKVAKRTVKENKKTIFTESQKESPSNDDIDQYIADKIMNNDSLSLIDQYHMLDATKYSTKLINYVMWYIKNPEATLLQDGISTIDKEFCNAISTFFGYGNIYEDAGLADLSLYNIDSSSMVSSPKFVISMARLININSDILKFKVMKCKEERLNKSVKPDDDLSAIKPIRFTTDNPDAIIIQAEDGTLLPTNKQGNLSNEMFTICEEFINPIMNSFGIKYAYTLTLCGLIELLFIVERQAYHYMIDPGSTLGNGSYCIIANLASANGKNKSSVEIVPLDNKEMVTRLLSPYQSNPSVEEAIEVEKDVLLSDHPMIQNLFDFSNVSLSEMTVDEKCALVTTLSKVCAVINRVIPNKPPRFRFKDYGNESTFVLVSDNNIINPFALYKNAYNMVFDGCTISVSDNKCTITNPITQTSEVYNMEDIV